MRASENPSSRGGLAVLAVFALIGSGVCIAQWVSAPNPLIVGHAAVTLVLVAMTLCLSLIYGTAALQRYERAQRMRCWRCDYPLTGIGGTGKCPECSATYAFCLDPNSLDRPMSDEQYKRCFAIPFVGALADLQREMQCDQLKGREIVLGTLKWVTFLGILLTTALWLIQPGMLTPTQYAVLLTLSAAAATGITVAMARQSARQFTLGAALCLYCGARLTGDSANGRCRGCGREYDTDASREAVGRAYHGVRPKDRMPIDPPDSPS